MTGRRYSPWVGLGVAAAASLLAWAALSALLYACLTSE